jgi:HAD superfamily hydrolase (TIGR01509 family)
MGLRKPEPAAFQRVLDYLALPPGRGAFSDDHQENVDAASELAPSQDEVMT